MREVLGHGYPQVSRALAAAVRERGADDMADVLDDLAAAVEAVPPGSPTARQDREREFELRGLRRATRDPEEWRRALLRYRRSYGDPPPGLSRDLWHPTSDPTTTRSTQ